MTGRIWKGSGVTLVVVAATAVVLADRRLDVSAPRPAAAVHAVAPMGANRAAHTATALADGRVLVAGGFIEKGSAVGAELFDGATARFLPAAPMLETRHSHTATRLADGTVLVVGGYGSGSRTLAAAEIFDPRSNRFTPAGSLHSARADHTAVLLGNGQVLVAGGLGEGWTYLSSAELYDPAARVFTPVGSMTVPRESHTAVRLDRQRVLIVGGHQGPRRNLTLHASAEIYDATSGTFTRAGDMLVRRHKHDAVMLDDGRVLVTGGADERDSEGVYRSTEFFTARTGTFSAGPPMQRPRYKHDGSVVALGDGRILISGGAPDAEVFDPATGAFAVVAGTPRFPGLFSAAATLPGGRVLVTGGYGSGTGPVASAWTYQP